MTEDSQGLYQHWLEGRLDHWQHVRQLLTGNRRDRSLEDAREVMDAYRSVARDLALARRHAPGTTVHRALESLYANIHKTLHAERLRPLAELWRLYAVRVPSAFRTLRADIVVTTGIFLASALGGWALVSKWRETAGWFMSHDMMLMVQNRTLWTDDILNVMPSSLLSYSLMTNNITVALTAFALGCVFGLGTLYIVLLNGFLLGSVFAYTAHFDMAAPLFRFIVAHGIVELSVICLAAAAGLALGRALARPGVRGRAESVRRVAGDAGALAAVCVPALIGCGLIEGYISPDDRFDMTIRVAVGLAWFAVLVGTLHGGLLRSLSYTWRWLRSDR